ncbi:GspE/PulE family protein [Breoghania sp. L-A4]|uniref:GspE/PulE family protein n=1 Tax=Breoghania sp. L-A4 TaxID=2304600 RepID=UPI0013C2DE0D|nr:GspE/PulE family protein [Breoghania sp. L-A4]
MSAALLEMEMLDQAAVARARRAYGETKAGFDTVLTELGLLSDEQLATFWSKWLEIPLLSEMQQPDEPILADLLTQTFLAANSVVPVRLEGEELWVAMADPLDKAAISAIEYLLDAEIRIVAATRKQIAELLKQLYESSVSVHQDGGSAAHEAHANDSDVEHLKALASDGPTIQRVNSILSQALEREASDVHLEPDQYGLQVRFRIDGYLQEVERIEPGARAAVISRVKIMARMDITERRVPQDGRVSVTIRGRNVDLRISTLPTVHGESTVIRLLRREEANLNWDKLGFSKDIQAKLGDVLSDPNGIFLVTGPTGSGKTTTLYTALRQLNARERKLVSVEDPVEYQLPGINQVQVQPEIGLDFASALRSILRQDPDIIMIGEIRDLETAEIAIRASLTGHLVLSTLHTNSAAAAITRLIEMGTAPYLVAACVRAVLSQRLVRTLCDQCSAPLEASALPPALRGKVGEQGGGFRRPVGCDACRGTGYAGRTVISELLMIDGPVRERILAGGGEDAISRAAEASGNPQLIDHGLEVAQQGRTSLEEVISIAGRRG